MSHKTINKQYTSEIHIMIEQHNLTDKKTIHINNHQTINSRFNSMVTELVSNSKLITKLK